MPSRKFALEPDGPKRLEIAWTGVWKDIQVLLDGSTIGTFANQQALKAGQEFPLPDGTRLWVQLAQMPMGPQLRVNRNGAPLPGSDADPAQQVKVAAGVLTFIGAGTLIVGALAAAGVQLLAKMGYGAPGMVEGVIFLVLAYFVNRRSLVALALAVMLFALDTVVSIVVLTQATNSPPVGGVVVRFFLFVPLIQAFGAIRKLKSQR